MNINKDLISERIELKNLTDLQKLCLDRIFNNHVDAHNFILRKIIEYDRNGKKYTRKDVMRDVGKILENTISDSRSIDYLFSDLNGKFINGESVEAKEYGGDNSYRTSVRSTKFKDGRLYITCFKEGIELEKGTNIREGFISAKISREDNKYYVIFGYHIEEKIELINLTDIQKEWFDTIIKYNVDAHNFILEKMIECKKNGESYTEKEARHDIRYILENNISDSYAIRYVFIDLNKQIRDGESVEKKRYGGDHSHRTSVRSTKVKDGMLHITYFKKEGLELEGDTNIREGFTSVKISREDNKYYVIFGYYIEEKIELKKLTEKQRERFDTIIKYNVDAHNLILEKMIECKKNAGSYTRKDTSRDLIKKLENNISDSRSIHYLLNDLNGKFINGESVEEKKYGEDHSYRTSVRSTKIKDGKLYITYFKEEGLELEGDTNIREGFTSVKILREDNKYYVIFGYYIEEKIGLKNLTDIQKERFNKIIKYYVDAHNLILEKMIECKKNAGSYTRKEVRHDISEILKNNILDKSGIGYVFTELNGKFINGESVEFKEYGGDHLYRTSALWTEVKYRILYIPRFKEGIELEEGINIREGFISVKILREDNKHYVIFGYDGSVQKKVKKSIDMKGKKYIYIIFHPSFEGYYKVGISKNCEARCNQLSIGVPYGEHIVKYELPTDNAEIIERRIHKMFKAEGEWVKANLQDIIKEIESLDKKFTESKEEHAKKQQQKLSKKVTDTEVVSNSTKDATKSSVPKDVKGQYSLF